MLEYTVGTVYNNYSDRQSEAMLIFACLPKCGGNIIINIIVINKLFLGGIKRGEISINF